MQSFNLNFALQIVATDIRKWFGVRDLKEIKNSYTLSQKENIQFS